MTIHVSLPKELEQRVHDQVNSGMYGSASEVVREALRRFFQSEETLTTYEIEQLRALLKPRLEAAFHPAELVDGESYFSSRISHLSE